MLAPTRLARVPERPPLRPAYLRRQAHQDRLDVAAGLQAEDRAAVVQQVELHVPPAPHKLMIPVLLRPWRSHAPADDPRIGIQERLAHIPDEGEIRLGVAG